MFCSEKAPAAQTLSRGNPNGPPTQPTSPSLHRHRQIAAAAFAVIGGRVNASSKHGRREGLWFCHLTNRPQALIQKGRHGWCHRPAQNVIICEASKAVHAQGLLKRCAQAHVICPRGGGEPKTAHWRTAPASTHCASAQALERMVFSLSPGSGPARAQQHIITAKECVAFFERLLSQSAEAVAG